jgi:hypothetical protein
MRTMSEWRSLESVPKDGTQVLFWASDDDYAVFDGGGYVELGRYDAALDSYCNTAGDEVLPICWMYVPRGPRSMEDIQWLPRREV